MGQVQIVSSLPPRWRAVASARSLPPRRRAARRVQAGPGVDLRVPARVHQRVGRGRPVAEPVDLCAFPAADPVAKEPMGAPADPLAVAAAPARRALAGRGRVAGVGAVAGEGEPRGEPCEPGRAPARARRRRARLERRRERERLRTRRGRGRRTPGTGGVRLAPRHFDRVLISRAPIYAHMRARAPRRAGTSRRQSSEINGSVSRHSVAGRAEFHKGDAGELGGRGWSRGGGNATKEGPGRHFVSARPLSRRSRLR